MHKEMPAIWYEEMYNDLFKDLKIFLASQSFDKAFMMKVIPVHKRLQRTKYNIYILYIIVSDTTNENNQKIPLSTDTLSENS